MMKMKIINVIKKIIVALQCEGFYQKDLHNEVASS